MTFYVNSTHVNNLVTTPTSCVKYLFTKNTFNITHLTLSHELIEELAKGLPEVMASGGIEIVGLGLDQKPIEELVYQAINTFCLDNSV